MGKTTELMTALYSTLPNVHKVFFYIKKSILEILPLYNYEL